MPRFIYFDLDDTLLDHRHAQHQALADVYTAYRFDHHSLEEVRAIYHTHNLEVWRRYARKELTKPEAKRVRFELLFEACGVSDVDPTAAGDEYFDFYRRHWRWCDGAEQAFLAIAERFPVGVLTNGFSAIQHAKLARFPSLRDRLAALVISEEVGHMKPAPEVFTHATERAGVERDDILYVGDSHSSDVQGGLAAGWQVAWYTRDKGQDEEGVFQFERWSEFTAWLKP